MDEDVNEISVVSEHEIYPHIFQFLYTDNIDFTDMSLGQIFSILLESKEYELSPLEALCSIQMALYYSKLNKERVQELFKKKNLEFFLTIVENEDDHYKVKQEMINTPGIELRNIDNESASDRTKSKPRKRKRILSQSEIFDSFE